MKSNSVSFAHISFVIVAVLIIGSVTIRQAYAQVEATSSEVAVSSRSVVPTNDTTLVTTENSVTQTTTDSTQAEPSTSGLVEVNLLCSQSYVTDVYDTPSGRPDPYDAPDVATTTDDAVARVIGQQSYTLCHDARGHVHEFTITAEEYAALLIRGTPQKSVMEPADEAALDSFDNS